MFFYDVGKLLLILQGPAQISLLWEAFSALLSSLSVSPLCPDSTLRSGLLLFSHPASLWCPRSSVTKAGPRIAAQGMISKCHMGRIAGIRCELLTFFVTWPAFKGRSFCWSGEGTGPGSP